MTDGVLSAEALAHLKPEAVSPGLIALVGPNAPTRTILCAGAGHFAEAHITLTQGVHLGIGDDAVQALLSNPMAIGDRTNSVVPSYGFTQAERELASAGGIA